MNKREALLRPVGVSQGGTGSSYVQRPYDPDLTYSWFYGLSGMRGTSAGVTNIYAYSSAVLGNPDGNWWGIFPQFNGKPGWRKITRILSRCAFWQTNNVYGYYVDIWRDAGTDLELMATTEEIPAQIGSAGSMNLVVTLPTPLEFTFEEGETYYVGLRARRTNAAGTTPQIGRVSDTLDMDQTTSACVRLGWNSGAFDGQPGSLFPKSDQAGERIFNQLGGTSIPLIRIDYESQLEEEQRFTPTAGKDFLVATRLDGPGFYKFDRFKMGPGVGSAMEFSEAQLDQSILISARPVYSNTGATPYVGMDGNNIDLNPIDPGDGLANQINTAFDWVIPYDLTTGIIDHFWQNTELEPIVHSHAAKHQAARDASYVLDTGAKIGLMRWNNADATIEGEFYSGARLMVVQADSQAIQGSVSTRRTLNTSRLGRIPAMMPRPMSTVLQGDSGRSYQSSAITLYKNATPGEGDGYELLKYDPLWGIFGQGVNDVSAAGSYRLARMKVEEMRGWLVDQLTDMVDKGIEVVIIGLPPYASLSADEWKAYCVRGWSRALLGAALSQRLVYYNPFPDVADLSTQYDQIPQWDPTYTDDDLHYNTAGGAKVSPLFVGTYTGGAIDERFSKQPNQ